MKPGGDTDILILGGGINGVAIARDAVQRGLKVRLVEAKDLCWGTSAGSTRLIHGGLRYLEYFEFGLVRILRERSILSEQRRLAGRAHRTFHCGPRRGSTLGEYAPLRSLAVPGFRLSLAVWCRCEQRFDSVASKKFPHLRADGVNAALRYFDCQVRYPERLVMELWNDAAAGGARLDKGHRVETLLRHEGRVVGAELDDGRCVYGQVVINATGHWVDALGQRVLMITSPNWLPLGAPTLCCLGEGMPRSGLYTYARSDGRALFHLALGQLHLGRYHRHLPYRPGCVFRHRG